MKHIFTFVVLSSLFIVQAIAQPVIPTKEVDLSSIDKFFELTSKISTGNTVSDEEWEELLNTQGYRIMATYQERKDAIRDIMLIAYSPRHSATRDSILHISMEEILSNQTLMMRRYMLENYLDMQKKQTELNKLRSSYDFSSLIPHATAYLKEFLPHPVDSFITAPPISMVCMELEAMSLNGGIVWDFNLFMRGNEQSRAKFLAHEMFHTYSSRWSKHTGESLPADPLFRQLNMIRNEGIADLIDKNDDYAVDMRNSGLPKELTDIVMNAYETTPNRLEQFEQIVLAFKNKKIDETQYRSQLKGFFKFAGHPNGYYMAQTIKKAGLLSELLLSFNDPVVFTKIYNKAARQANKFVFSDEFIEHISKLQDSDSQSQS